jgi:hypothetical protein
MLTGGAREPEGNDMTLMKDLGWMVLIGLLMAVAFVGVAIILVQSLYRWARGNTTSTSRVGAPILVSTRSP